MLFTTITTTITRLLMKWKSSNSSRTEKQQQQQKQPTQNSGEIMADYLDGRCGGASAYGTNKYVIYFYCRHFKQVERISPDDLCTSGRSELLFGRWCGTMNHIRTSHRVTYRQCSGSSPRHQVEMRKNLRQARDKRAKHFYILQSTSRFFVAGIERVRAVTAPEGFQIQVHCTLILFSSVVRFLFSWFSFTSSVKYFVLCVGAMQWVRCERST